MSFLKTLKELLILTRLEEVMEDFLKSLDSTSQIDLVQIDNIQPLLLFPEVVDQQRSHREQGI